MAKKKRHSRVEIATKLAKANGLATQGKLQSEIVRDPPPLKWSDLRYVFDIQEDCNGKEAIQA
jgi:hypothetical protein